MEHCIACGDGSKWVRVYPCEKCNEMVCESCVSSDYLLFRHEWVCYDCERVIEDMEIDEEVNYP